MNKFILLLSLAILAASASASEEAPLESPWSIEVSGLTHHFEHPLALGHKWNQANWGLSVQYQERDVDSTWSHAYAAVSLKDSLGVNGVYVGVIELKS